MKCALSMHVLILVLVGWTTSALAYDLASYFKILKPGAQWEYKEKSYADGQSPDSVAWKDSRNRFFITPEIKDGQTLFQEWEIQCLPVTDIIDKIHDYEVWSLDSANLYYHKFGELGATCTCTHVSGIPRYVDDGGTVDFAFAFTCNDGGSDSDSVPLTVLGAEDVTVTAGAFSSCLKIGIGANKIAWFAKNIGRVKSLTQDGDSGDWSLEELESYHIPPMEGDMDGDNKVGLPEAVNALQTCAGFRQDDAYYGIRQTLDAWEALFATSVPTTGDPGWDAIISGSYYESGYDHDGFINFFIGHQVVGLGFEKFTIMEESEGDPKKVRVNGFLTMDGKTLTWISFWFAQEEGTWKLVGNGWDMAFSVKASASWDQVQNSLNRTGLHIAVEDENSLAAGLGIDHFVVTGPGLPQSGATLREAGGGEYWWHHDNQTWYYYDESDGLDIAAIPPKAEYVFTAFNAAGDPVQAGPWTYVLDEPPISSARLSAHPETWFFHIITPDAATLQAFSGGDLLVQWDNLKGQVMTEANIRWWQDGQEREGESFRADCGAQSFTAQGIGASIAQADHKTISLNMNNASSRGFETVFTVDCP